MNTHEYLRDGFAYLLHLFSAAVGLCLVLGFAGGVILMIFVYVQISRVPDLSQLKDYHPVGTIQFFDKSDHLVCSVEQDINRQIVPLKYIPKHVRQAVLAAEDRRFYQHNGVSVKGMLRAVLVNVEARHIVEGGSTITQQLAKNLFFADSGRSIDRKIAESVVAFELEKRYTKDEILTLYLNEIYFGNGANGIEQAALRYFGKDIWKINVPEAAFLAGLIKSPSNLGSEEHREQAINRQRQVLDAMAECGFLTDYQAHSDKFYPLQFRSALAAKPKHPFTVFPYYISYALDLVHNRYPDSLISRRGLKVYTNLDPVAQQCGEQTLAQEIRRAPAGITEEALIAMSVRDASIRAIVGGAHDYWTNQWNSATNPHTVGSTFKPFVYLTAFAGGIMNPESTIEDTELTVHQVDSADYKPKNFDGKFLGRITVRQALSQSRNVCAVRVAQMVGMSNVITTARAAGITGDIAPNISSALGSSALSPLDVCGAYGTFARCGVSITPRVFRKVETMNGDVVETFDSNASRAFSEESVANLDSILEDVVRVGTGTQARLGDRPCAGKTGTADRAKDIWFVGYTPDMVTAVWGGSTKNELVSDKHVTGGTVMARAWREYNRRYYSRVQVPAGEFISDKYNATPAPAKVE